MPREELGLGDVVVGVEDGPAVLVGSHLVICHAVDRERPMGGGWVEGLRGWHWGIGPGDVGRELERGVGWPCGPCRWTAG